jgi:hypothetical protein
MWLTRIACHIKLMPIGSCIVIYSYSTTNKMHLLYYLFLLNSLHVSDGLSVHHHDLKTVYTAKVCVKELQQVAAAV